MRGKQATKLRQAASDVAHSQNEVSLENTFQYRIADRHLLTHPIQSSNVVEHGDDLIFVQRKLDSRSLKKIVGNWKRYMKTLSGKDRYSFMENLRVAYSV